MVNHYSIGGLIAVAAITVAIQFVPFGRDHANPPVVQEPKWDSPQTRELAVRVCFNCHSNQTDWPWYSNIAPMSWLIQNDVNQARDQMNFSEWDRIQREARKAPQLISSGEMPKWYYVFLHPEAQLTSAEKQALMQGLRATLLNR